VQCRLAESGGDHAPTPALAQEAVELAELVEIERDFSEK
jgi:hypothetical protein